MKQQLLLSWSSGKDSAWTLEQLRGQPDKEVVGLLTTFNEEADRVAMHAVRRDLVQQQADALGLPLWAVDLPFPCSNEDYEERMSAVIAKARDAGITQVAFGDLYLEDVRAYRERAMAGCGVEPTFPLWCGAKHTPELARTMIEGGLRAVITCVDPRQLPASFLGRTYDDDFLSELPCEVDPCGERGEFHTFCVAGPMFEQQLEVRQGERVDRDGFCFLDLLPAEVGVAANEQPV